MSSLLLVMVIGEVLMIWQSVLYPIVLGSGDGEWPIVPAIAKYFVHYCESCLVSSFPS